MKRPLSLEPSDSAKAGFLGAHRAALNARYTDGLGHLLDRAKHMAAGMGIAADSVGFAKSKGLDVDGMSHAEIAALAFTIAETIEAAQALLQGFCEDLQTLAEESKP